MSKRLQASGFRLQEEPGSSLAAACSLKPVASCLALFALGCGAEAAESDGVLAPSGRAFAPLEVVTGAPDMPAESPPLTTIVLEHAATHLGATSGFAVVGTVAGAYALRDGVALPLDVWDDDAAAPAAIGAVHALARRGEELLLAGDGGLLLTYEDKLLLSPASLGVTPLAPRALFLAGTGADEVMWIAGAQGLYAVVDGTIKAWGIPSTTGGPDALAYAQGMLFAAWGEQLFEIDVAARVADPVPHALGAIRRIAVLGESVYFAADAGLVERGADGSYRVFTLSADEPAAVHDLAIDPLAGALAIVDGAVVLAAGGVPQAVAALAPAGGMRVAACDDLGTVWIGDGTQLSAVALGEPVSFASDVAPIVAASCMSCHAAPGANDAPPVALDAYDVAAERAGQIVERIATGQMPPASATPLTTREVALVLRWKAGGLAP